MRRSHNWGKSHGRGVTQIMNLLNLAPDTQEQILFLNRESGRTERHL